MSEHLNAPVVWSHRISRIGKDAGKIIARITRREPALKSKTQQVLNDILLALSGRRIGADLYTFNRADFELIRRPSSFSLKVLKR